MVPIALAAEILVSSNFKRFLSFKGMKPLRGFIRPRSQVFTFVSSSKSVIAEQ